MDIVERFSYHKAMDISFPGPEPEPVPENLVIEEWILSEQDISELFDAIPGFFPRDMKYIYHTPEGEGLISNYSLEGHPNWIKWYYGE